MGFGATRLSGVIVGGALMFAAALTLGAPSGHAQVVVNPGESVTFDTALSARVVENCGQLSVSFCDAAANSAPPDEAYVLLDILVGLVTDLNVESTLFQPFSVSLTASGVERVLAATVSGNVSWRGELTAIGVASNEAEININAELFDVTTGSVAGATEVFSQTVKTSGIISTDAASPSGTQPISFNANVIRGHDYEIRLSAECRARTDLGEAGCEFVSTQVGPTGFVRWNEFSITIAADQIEILEDIQDRLSTIEKMLQTPQGRRPGYPEDGF